MSDTKNISPLLDGFSLGTAMSEHDGIRCCPAIKDNTEEKYIVKIITIPASQVQLDALLLAGAYKDPEGAMEYYKKISEEILQEAELLKTLSKIDGFLAYDGWQLEPITRHRLGFEVYLLGSYRHSLEKYIKKNPVTHLEAVNLGLDLCAALTVCRQAGYIYADLKPANVFVSDKKEYRIGDLGFIHLDALRYTALPKRCLSSYTPPELFDPMAQLNLTLDSYAVGMILYQLYNDGQLPGKAESDDLPVPSPIHADYELAEIIMKAIHPDPEQRWASPSEMGKAIAAYMQRNVVNDVPITPHNPLEIQEDEIEHVPPAEELPDDCEAAAEPAAEDTSDPSEPSVSDEEVPIVMAEDVSEDTPEIHDEILPSTDETVPDDGIAEDLLPHEISEELSKILEKAEDLIAHEMPEGVIVPEIPELPDPFAFIFEDSDEIDDTGIPQDPVMEDPDEVPVRKKPKRSFSSGKVKRILRKALSMLASFLVVVVIVMAGFVYYKFFYLQTIDRLLIDGDQNNLTVTVGTGTDFSKLHVTCSDPYGNVKKKALMDGSATFTGLKPNTIYTIQLEIDGFHKLVGKTSDIFTTDATTNIVSFNAVTGKDDGTVMLNFTVDGEEPETWRLHYSAEGEKEKTETFTGHSVSLRGLSVGKVYTFTLDAGNSLSLSGATSLQFLASRLILAEEVTVTSNGKNDMNIHWKAPGDIIVDSWEVRCYNDAGYEQQLTVSDTSVYLSGIDPTVGYTIEVMATGMTQPVRTSITANPINITNFHVDDASADSISVSWEYAGTEPEGGWLLMYSMDGGNTQSVLKCKTAAAVITPKIPDAKYQFTIQAVNGTSIFSNIHTYTCPSAEGFNANQLSWENIEGMLTKTPADAFWHYGKLEEGAITDQFQVGDPISLILHANTDFYLPGAQEIRILYVIRDAYGNVIPDLLAEESNYWKEIWNAGDYHYAELDIPKLPQSAGNYTLDVFFNGYAMAEVTFTLK